MFFLGVLVVDVVCFFGNINWLFFSFFNIEVDLIYVFCFFCGFGDFYFYLF